MNWRLIGYCSILLLLPLLVNAQQSEERIKASMLFYLSEYIEWPEDVQKNPKFTIGLADATDDFQNELTQIVKSKKKIHNKELSILNISITDIPKSIHVLFLGPQYYQNAESILEYCKANAILLVTNEMKNNLLTVINFYYNEEKQAINFGVNKQNIILSKLNYRDDILLYGGTLLDIKELYQSTQRLLEQESQKANDFSQQIIEKSNELKTRNNEVRALNDSINLSNNLLNEMTDSISRLQSLANKWQLELLEKQQSISAIKFDYQNIVSQREQQESIIIKNNNTLEELDKRIVDREIKINAQRADIDIKNAQIKARDKSLIVSLIIGLIISSIGVFFIYAYRTKNRYNKLLETKVEERTFELQKSERDYREIFNGVSDYIFIQDENGKILTVNQPMLDAYGYTMDELVHLDVGKISAQSQGYTNEKAAEMFQLAKNNGEHTFDWMALRKNNETFWVIVTLRLTKIGGNSRLLAVVRDNDTNKKNELELEKYRFHLEQLVKEKTEELESINEELVSTNEELHTKNNLIEDQNVELNTTLDHLKETQAQLFQSEKMASIGVLTAGVAHEINNPLNYIMGAYNGLESIHSEKSYEENSTTIDFLLISLKEGIERATKIVTGLNLFSRNSKSLEENCKLHEIIDNCLTMLNNKLKYHISVEKEFCTNEIIIKGNVGNLHQTFLNILNNAEQAILGDGIITIKTSCADNKAIIMIKDNGCGISPENLEKITDPFFTTKDPGKGTGLGLSIVYSIIQEHKGTLNFKSEVNKGTIVSVTLPTA